MRGMEMGFEAGGGKEGMMPWKAMIVVTKDGVKRERKSKEWD